MLAPHVDALVGAGVSCAVIQGWPPGAEAFASAASQVGIEVLTVFHSSPAQHGVDGGEAEAVTSMMRLSDEGRVARIGTVKSGLVDAFASIGHTIHYTPNRVPVIDAVAPIEVPDGTNVGIFLHPLWRKNVTTQVLAALGNGWRPHVMGDPGADYLPRDRIVVHGELDRSTYFRTQAAMDISFNVTLSECHPMMPMESYRLGVPCLMSRTSALFTDDQELMALTTLTRADDPSAIAGQATELLDNRTEAIDRANASLDRTDADSAYRWKAFTGRSA